MRRIALVGLVLLLAIVVPAARAQTPQRTVRVGNVNVLLFGLGYPSFDHPNFEDQSFPSLTYQHRILRREVRQFPIWLRGAATFLSQNRKIEGYTVWQVGDEVPFRELVSEHTSDFTVRLEGLVDVLHTRNWAVYGGGGFALHGLTFNSDGAESQIPQFKSTSNELGPSLAAGARWFMAERATTLYAEVRYGKVFGRNDPVPGGTPYLTDQTFAFTSVDCVSFEGGIGVHW